MMLTKVEILWRSGHSRGTCANTLNQFIWQCDPNLLEVMQAPTVWLVVSTHLQNVLRLQHRVCPSDGLEHQGQPKAADAGAGGAESPTSTFDDLTASP
jgi:hypothetical protein